MKKNSNVDAHISLPLIDSELMISHSAGSDLLTFNNSYDNSTLNSIFRPNAFIKKKHALQYQLHSLLSTILY